jgi:hypothetical protein
MSTPGEPCVTLKKHTKLSVEHVARKAVSKGWSNPNDFGHLKREPALGREARVEAVMTGIRIARAIGTNIDRKLAELLVDYNIDKSILDG